MDFNFKILKYNITLALILSGLFYTKHPEQVHEYISSVVGIPHKSNNSNLKKQTNVKNENQRKIASVKIDEDEDNLMPPEAESPVVIDDGLEDPLEGEDSPKFSKGDPLDKKKAISKEKNKPLSSLKKAYEKLKKIISPPSSIEEDKEETVFWGGWFSKKKEETTVPTRTGSPPSRRPTVAPCIKPIAPQQLLATLSSNQGNLTWQDLGPAITYNVFRGSDPSSLSLLVSQLTVSNYTDVAMSPGTLYYYQVSSSNTCGNSLDYSNQSQIKSLGQFAITSISASADSVSLSWGVSDGADSYLVYYGTTSGVYTNSVNLTSPSTISLPGGNTYFLKVQAVNGFGAIDSSEVSIYVPLSFSTDITFNTLADYTISDGLKINNSKAYLESSNLISEKTLFSGSGTSGDNVFDDYTYLDPNLIIENDSIKMTSGASGTYISKVFDGKNDTTAWSKLNFITSLPFGKEISLSQESNYQDTTTDFSTNLRLLYHFNGPTGVVIPTNTSISSPITGHSALAANSDNLGMQLVNGKFKQALRLDGVNDYVVTNYTQTAVTAYTISVWMRTTTTGARKVFVHNRGSGAGKSLTLGMGTSGGGHGAAGQISWEVDSDMLDIGVSSTQAFNDGQWHHVVGTWSASAGTAVHSSQFKIYVDGNLVTTTSGSTGSVTSPLTGLGTTIIGYHQPWGSYFPGDLDEVAIWSKSLTLAEIQELYVRGANKLKLQIRTCSSKFGLDCAGTISNWSGIDGTSSTYFSEQENNLSPLSSVGVVNPTFFQTPFSLFTGGLTAWLSTGKNGSDRYIQYKAIFESTTSLSYPDLYRVSFEPASRYSLNATVSNNLASAIDFNYLSGLVITQTCSDSNNNSLDDDIKYEISLDAGRNYYSYHTGVWSISNSFASANTKAEVESLTSNEFKLIPTSSGKLMIRSYLTSNGTNSCEVDNIQVNGAR